MVLDPIAAWPGAAAVPVAAYVSSEPLAAAAAALAGSLAIGLVVLWASQRRARRSVPRLRLVHS